MKNLKRSRGLYITLTILFVFSLLLGILGFVLYAAVSDDNSLARLIVFFCVAFQIFCWWMARTVARVGYENAERLVEIEELLVRHGIAFPEVETVSSSCMKSMRDDIEDESHSVDEVAEETAAEEPAEEELAEDEFLRIDAEIDETIKREVVNLLSSGHEMKAMLLLTNAGVPMDVAVRYIDRLKLNL